MKIGDYVKNYRHEHGLSMQAFGNKCNLSRAYISILEKGINPTTNKPFSPTLETLKKIADVTNTDLDTLLKMLEDNRTVIVNATTTPQLTPRDERQIAADLEKMLADLDSQNTMAATCNTAEDDEDRELLRASLQATMRLAKKIAKEKYTPKKQCQNKE